MDIINYLGVMADSIESFMENISLLEVLIVVAFFIGVVFLVLITHVVCGIKAHTARQANSLSRYFEHYYLGTYLDGKKFLKVKRFALNRHAREEFSIFLNSNTNIRDTEFVHLVLAKGEGGFGMTLGIFNVAIAIGTAFLLLKSYVSNIYGVEAFVLNGLSLTCMFIVKLALYGTMRYVCLKMEKASCRLDRAIGFISYNNEYGNLVTREDIVDRLEPKSVDRVDAEQVIARMQDMDSAMDGETQEMVLDNINAIKGCLSDSERQKYQEVLDKYGIKIE